jgi:ribose transport system substrate-binding protein
MKCPQTVDKEENMGITNQENLYKEVLRTMSECVLILEQSGKMTALNENVEKVLGIKSEFLTESSLMELEFVREDGSPIPFLELREVMTLKQRIPLQHFIIGVNGQNPDIKWLSINSTPLKMDEYGKQAALVTISDITERKKMEKAIIEAKEEAVKANMAKSDFLSKMSHELRTPLNGILGFAQLLEMDESLTDQQRDYVREILGGGAHLLNLINDILDLSRIESGKLKVSIEEVDLLTVLNECIHIVQPLSNKKNIRIHKKWNKWQNTYVLADPTRLKQILLNLLDNAIKYNREGGRVTITCHIEENEQKIHMIDTGVGLSVEEYHKIFVPFYRVQGHKKKGQALAYH